MTTEKGSFSVRELSALADSLEAEMREGDARAAEQRVRDHDAIESLYGTEAERLFQMRYAAVGPDEAGDLARIAEGRVSAVRWSRARALLLAALVAGFTQHPLAFPAALVVYLLSRLIDVVADGNPSYLQQMYSAAISQEMALRNILVEVRKLAGRDENDRRP